MLPMRLHRLKTAETLFTLILAGYLLVGALFAIYTPAWQAPDEPAHYNYVRQVADDGCCPRIEQGDWDSDALGLLTSSRFASEHLRLLPAMQYEDHQPPLYYFLASVIYRLGDGALIPLRIVSVILGAGVVALGYVITRCLLPTHLPVALGVMALVAFLPQRLHMLASVNNDALAELVVALCLCWIVRRLDGEHAPVWLAGLIVGAAFVTKITVYFVALLVPLTLWLRWRGDGSPLRELAREIAVYALIACVIGGLWWLRNIGEYGFPDAFGLGAHDAVVSDQLRTADYIAEHGFGAYLSGMARTFFVSSFGQFGWMALPVDGVLGGLPILLYGLLPLAGVAGAWRVARQIKSTARVVLLAVIALVALQTLFYNIEFVQWQGRYFFPALVPAAILIVCGASYWLRRREWARWLLPLGLAGLAVLDVYLLFRVIAPGLSP